MTFYVISPLLSWTHEQGFSDPVNVCKCASDRPADTATGVAPAWRIRSPRHGRGRILPAEQGPHRRRQGWRRQDHDLRRSRAIAAEAGLSVLLVELEGKAGLARAFGDEGPLEYEGTALMDATESTGEVSASRITPDDALLEYLADHGMKRFSKRLVSSGALDVVATAIPGIRDILVLGKVKQLERSTRPISLRGRPRHRSRDDIPVVSEWAPRRGPVRASPYAGGGRRRPPHRSQTAAVWRS